ncbi:hypothetical protein ACTFIW_003889 [Dictyostelium discoideum]
MSLPVTKLFLNLYSNTSLKIIFLEINLYSLLSKKHQGYIFLTVGSKDKEEYLTKKYGSLITAIYSSRNKDYIYEILDLEALEFLKQSFSASLLPLYVLIEALFEAFH